MATITANDDILAVLGLVKEVTEINDSQGNSLGVFTPASVLEDRIYDQIRKQIDLDEIRRIKATETKFHTFDQVKERIRSLESAR